MEQPNYGRSECSSKAGKACLWLVGHSGARFLNEPSFESSPNSTECGRYLALPSEHLSSKYSAPGGNLDFCWKKKSSECLIPSRRLDVWLHYSWLARLFWLLVCSFQNICLSRLSFPWTDPFTLSAQNHFPFIPLIKRWCCESAYTTSVMIQARPYTAIQPRSTPRSLSGILTCLLMISSTGAWGIFHNCQIWGRNPFLEQISESVTSLPVLLLACQGS